MQITAITKYKHGELYAILKRLGWSQSKLAKQSNLTPNIIGNIINLVKRPTAKQADAIQKALGAAGEYLDVLLEWPEAFEGLKRGYKREQTVKVQMDRLIDHPEALQIACHEYKENHLNHILDAAISELPKKIQTVLRERFWDGKTLEGIGKNINESRERVRQIEAKGLRKLRCRIALERRK